VQQPGYAIATIVQIIELNKVIWQHKLKVGNLAHPQLKGLVW
jgi:hypothetical protein